MAYRNVGDVRFHVQELGPSVGQPVLMLHGLFADLSSWYLTCAPSLAMEGYRVFLADLRGHGLSGFPTGRYDCGSMIDDVLTLTDHLGPMAAVGHSYGALVALRLATQHPERVSSLAMIDPPLASDDAVADDAAPSGHKPPASAESDAPRTVELIARTSILEDLETELPVADAELRGVTVPMLVCFGNRSPWGKAASRVRRTCPEARCVELAGGHDLHVDATRALTGELSDFLRADPGTREAEDRGIAYG